MIARSVWTCVPMPDRGLILSLLSMRVLLSGKMCIRDRLSADYEAEQRELKEKAAAIQAELSKAQEATVNAEKFMNVVRRHTSFEELTPTLLREFVEKIVVHECSYDENKTRRQDIEIYYSFVGKVDLPE